MLAYKKTETRCREIYWIFEEEWNCFQNFKQTFSL